MATQKYSRNAGLDFLRFILALMVLISHARGVAFERFANLDPVYQTKATFVFFGLTRLGHEAVIGFFVLSGFLVGGPNLFRLQTGRFNPLAFSIDRVTRLWVPLIPALAFTLLVSPSGPKGPFVLVANLFGLQGAISPNYGNNGPLWSLSYEVWFYVGFLGSLMLLSKAGKSFTGWLLIVLTALIFSKLSPHYILIWILGSVAYRHSNAIKPSIAFFISILLLPPSILASNLSTDGSMQMATSLSAFHALYEMAVAISFSLMIVAIKSGILERFLGFWRRVPDFSYSTYLVHYPALAALSSSVYLSRSKVDIIGISIFIALVLLSLFLGFVMHFFFEKRTSNIRTALWSHLKTPAVSPAPVIVEQNGSELRK